jgi:hypothetical protein
MNSNSTHFEFGPARIRWILPKCTKFVNPDRRQKCLLDRGWPDSKDNETLITHRKYNKVSGMQCEGWNALGGHLEKQCKNMLYFAREETQRCCHRYRSIALHVERARFRKQESTIQLSIQHTYATAITDHGF